MAARSYELPSMARSSAATSVPASAASSRAVAALTSAACKSSKAAVSAHRVEVVLQFFQRVRRSLRHARSRPTRQQRQERRDAVRLANGVSVDVAIDCQVRQRTHLVLRRP